MPEEMANHESDRLDASIPSDSDVDENVMALESVPAVEPEAVHEEAPQEPSAAAEEPAPPEVEQPAAPAVDETEKNRSGKRSSGA
jgi:hypothetical protein